MEPQKKQALANAMSGKDWRHYAGPHVSGAVDRTGQLVDALMGAVGPQADVQDMRTYSGNTMDAINKGKMADALANFGMTGAAAASAFIPGGVGMVDDFSSKVKPFLQRALKDKPDAPEKEGIWHSVLSDEKRELLAQSPLSKLAGSPVVHRIGGDRLRKSLTKHSKDGIPLTEADISLLPDVAKRGEIVAIEPSRDKTAKLSVISRIKSADGNWLYVIEDLRRNTLDLTTAYKKPGPKEPGS